MEIKKNGDNVLNMLNDAILDLMAQLHINLMSATLLEKKIREGKV